MVAPFSNTKPELAVIIASVTLPLPLSTPIEALDPVGEKISIELLVIAVFSEAASSLNTPVDARKEPVVTAEPAPKRMPAGENSQTPPVACRVPLMVVKDVGLTTLKAMEFTDG